MDIVQLGIGALAKQLQGRALSSSETRALESLQARTGARRPLAQYAPRTRRRYLAIARSTQTPGQAKATEYQRRKESVAQRTGGLTPTQYTEINKLLKQRNAYFTEQPTAEVDWDILSNFVMAFGYRHVRTILKEELESIRAYIREDSSIGQRRWDKRQDITKKYKKDVTLLLGNVDILYFYHGTMP